MSPSVSVAEDKPDGKKECLVASEQGQNQRDDGRYRAARESFLSCARDVCPRVITQSCTRWLRELDQDAPTVVLGAKDGQGSDLTDVKVSFDGSPFAAVLDGKPIEADAGEHVLRFERDGSAPVEQKLVLRAGEKARVVTVTLPSVNGPAPTPEAAPPPAPEEAPRPPEPLLSAHHVTAAALAVAALGAAGTGVFFLMQSNQDGDGAATLRGGLAPNACAHGTTPACQTLNDKVNSQHQEMTIATALFAGAGALAAGAIVTWLVWPQSSGPPPQATGWLVPTQGGATLHLGGSF
jgi:hypothetical protein